MGRGNLVTFFMRPFSLGRGWKYVGAATSFSPEAPAIGAPAGCVNLQIQRNRLCADRSTETRLAGLREIDYVCADGHRMASYLGQQFSAGLN
jgi:hypothetical protein